MFSASDAERFTRNIPNAYAVCFESETEAYHYWEKAFRAVSARLPIGWRLKKVFNEQTLLACSLRFARAVRFGDRRALGSGNTILKHSQRHRHS